MSGKLKKKDLKYHTSVLYDKIHFDWSGIQFKYQDEPIAFHLQYKFFSLKILKLKKL